MVKVETVRMDNMWKSRNIQTNPVENPINKGMKCIP